MNRYYTRKGAPVNAYQLQNLQLMFESPKIKGHRFKITFDERTEYSPWKIEIFGWNGQRAQTLYADKTDYLLHFELVNYEEDQYAIMSKNMFKELFEQNVAKPVNQDDMVPDPEIKLLYDIDNGKYNQVRDDSRGSNSSAENGSTVTYAV